MFSLARFGTVAGLFLLAQAAPAPLRRGMFCLVSSPTVNMNIRLSQTDGFRCQLFPLE